MLPGQDRNSMVHYCAGKKKTEADNVFDFVGAGYLSLQVALYNCGRTRGSERFDEAVRMDFLQNNLKHCRFARSLAPSARGPVAHCSSSINHWEYILERAR